MKQMKQGVFEEVLIGSTKDYEMFKIIDANRSIKQSNVEKLMKSFKLTKGMSKSKPIIVDNKMNVIDGQHRLAACKQLGIPVHYIVSDDTFDNIPIYNANQEKWGMEDYANYYSKKGNKSYTNILIVKDRTHASLDGCLEVLFGRGGNVNTNFKDGTFIFNADIEDSVAKVNMMLKICSVVTGKHAIKRKIVRAVKFLNRMSSFDLERLITKISKYPARMHGCGSSEEYIDMFIDIYNWHQPAGKISSVDVIEAKNSIDK